jgi:phosphatidylserine/phosphatidylglycerophosphate/cardiolipin synthase-like enzyme
MSLAKAFANNDVVILVWDYENPIDNCLGFCIQRKDIKTNRGITLESMVGFKKESIETRQFRPTSIWPIQKFNWRDFTATSGDTYEYTIIPMIGTPDDLKPGTNLQVVTNQVTLTPGSGKIKAFFNRGILSTQYLAGQVPKSSSGIPNYHILLERIKQPGDKLRNSLTDELKDALMSLLDKAINENGECYCALYELNDTELLEKLLKAKDRLHIILSNTGADDKTNEVSRASLHGAGVDIIDRMVASNHIGHNKFVIYLNAQGKPTTVLTGSTNWTYTGLCAQSNNAIIIESDELAGHYFDYWNRMKEDDAKQGAQFRKDNNRELTAKVDGTDITLWFSPNTEAQNKTAKSPRPNDIAKVFDVMNSAKKSILFLAFQPGTPGIIDEAANIQLQKPNLFIRGAATDLEAVEASGVTLFHRGVHDPVIVGAQELKDDFAYWMAELLKSSPSAHAIIHDKLVVIDAFTDNCIVITGSHNLGYRASYNNDENLLIIKGNNELTTSYATHVLDVYDHYRWRYYLSKNTQPSKRFEGLNTQPSWQNPYFNELHGESIDKRFWL